jgi:hypothetical protein
MALYKMVNGVRVQLTPEQEAETLAQWEVEQNRPPPDFEQQELDQMERIMKALVAEIAELKGVAPSQVMQSMKNRMKQMS